MLGDREAIRTRSTPATSPEDSARRSLDFIRDTLERSSSFTAVPGWGNVLIGTVGSVAAWVASSQPTEARWLAVWLTAAVVSLLIGAITASMKAVKIGVPVLGGPGRKFVYGLAPAFLVGALFTAVFYESGLVELLPAVWLLLYGAAIVSAGIHSIPLIRTLGMAFMLAGTAALFMPPDWGDALLGVGFGAFHIVAGTVIIKRFGG